MKRARCPECDGYVVVFDEVIEGEIYQCQDCGSELEVAESFPKIVLQEVVDDDE